MNNRISEWLEKKRKIVEEQGGFRAKRSTTEQIFILKETIQGRRRGKKSTFGCFLDIRKAYDTVCREGWWKRMEDVESCEKFVSEGRELCEVRR